MAKRQARDGWLDRLEAAPAAARIVNMSSVAYSMTKGINFDDIKLMSSTAKNPISAWTAYSQSKLANVLFTRSLGKRLRGTNVIANCLNPGGIS